LSSRPSSATLSFFRFSTDSNEKPAESESTEQTDKIEVDAAEWESKQKEVKEAKEKMLYALAEAQNVRRRSEEEIDRVRKYASQGFAKDMLDVADNLDMAIKATEKSGAVELMNNESAESKALKTLYEGLVLTQKEIVRVLNTNSVTKIEALGVKFDPNVHDALFEVEDASKEVGTVAVVMKDGYMYKDRVLRPARVGTVKKSQ
jgi:molecular chaperone GrpE